MLDDCCHFAGCGVKSGAISDGTLEGDQRCHVVVGAASDGTLEGERCCWVVVVAASDGARDRAQSLSVKLHFIFTLLQFKQAQPGFTKHILSPFRHQSHRSSGGTGPNPTSARNDAFG